MEIESACEPFIENESLKRGKGRPTLYTDDLADMMCQIIRTHHESDEDLCNLYDFFPPYRTFCTWKDTYPHFQQAYKRAKDLQLEVCLDNLQKELDNESKDFTEFNNRLYANNGRSNRLRCKVGHLQWRAAVVNPEKYGNKKIEDKIDGLKDQVVDMLLNVEKSRDKL